MNTNSPLVMFGNGSISDNFSAIIKSEGGDMRCEAVSCERGGVVVLHVI